MSVISLPRRLIVAVRIGAVVVVLAAVALTGLFLRGPAAWQRQYFQLTYEAQIGDSAVRHQVSPYLVASVIEAESDWRPTVRSDAGAVGLMQLLPSTAAELARRGLVDPDAFPVERLSDPRVNIEYGTAYLRYLVERYHEVEAALAAYNAGMGNADRWVAAGGDIRESIEFPETRHFVLKVSRGKDRYQQLYPDAFPQWTAR